MGGKFRKKPFRRTTHSTPYDRPPTAIRNTTGGWFSKLVDPAHRLITSSAHRFFSTVLRKRLPPPQAPSRAEENYEARNKKQDADAPDSPGDQRGGVEQIDSPSKCANGGGLNDLEQILKQKTFSRSEIDRLTALLHSRTVDTSIVNQEKRSEVIPLKSFTSLDRQDTSTKIPAQTNGIESHLVSTPAVSSSVLAEDVASPADVAKAYMGSRPSKVYPSKLGIRSQVFRENSAALSSLPSNLPVTPLVPRTSGHDEAPINGFITPRSRGRSAIYSMARTPYSRVHQTTLKGVGSAINASDGPSSSQAVWEQSLVSASKQGALKRRSSVLDNEIASFGPIRRIRQKQSFLSSRGLSSPVSGNISVSGGGLGSEASQKPSSIQKLNSFENGANSIPSTSFSVPSKSSEMASKILQQLDKLVSPKDKSSESKLLTLMDKSPTKLSPSMLHGRALKSLEAVDSSKFLGDVQDSSKLDGLVDKAIPDALNVTSLKQDMDRENGPLKIVASCDKSTVVNGVDSAVLKKDTLLSVETTISTTPISVAYPPQKKKRAFKMSAHEDSLELDDDGYCNGTASHSLTDGVQKVDTSSAKRKGPVTEVVRLEKPSALLDGMASTSAMNKKPDPQNSFGSVHGEENSNFIISSTSSPSTMVLSTEVATQSSLTSDSVSPPKESNAALPMFSFGSKAIDKIPQSSLAFASSPAVVAQSAGASFGFFSGSKPESSSSLSAVPAGAIDSVLKVPESEKVGSENISNAGLSFRTSETGLPSSVSSSASTTSTFSFGTPHTSSLNNGSLASTSATLVVSSLTSQNSSNSSSFTSTVNSIPNTSITTASTSGGLSTSTPAPSFPAVSVFKFGSSTGSTAVAPVSATSDLPSPETVPKQETSFGTLSGTTLSDTAAATANTGSSIFGFGATATSTADNQTQGSSFLATSVSMPITQPSSAGTGISTFSQSMPLQFGSSTSSPSFGLAGTTTLASGNSIPVSTAAKLFTTGSTGLGSSASLSETNSIGSGSGTAPSLFGTSWQPAKSSVFVSTLNSTSPSSGFSFGASTASSAPANSLPVVFGASTASAGTKNSVPSVFGSSNGSSASSIFSFTSPSTTASIPPAFGNPNSVFAFGSTTSATNDQMNMEDSMAEDTVAAAGPSVPVFGQQPVPASTSGYVFGSVSPSVGNPFQFGSQQNLAAPQNPSPFQASGSLGFIADGSNFSMGSGGGGGGGDKNSRRIIKVKHNKLRKK